MKKLEQAIAYFEDAIRESDEIIAECSEALQKELTEQKGYFVVAVEVMKEKQEREKGCGCCQDETFDAETLPNIMRSLDTELAERNKFPQTETTVDVIDAVSVVRCKDCKHYNTIGCSKGFGWCENMDRGTSDNFYCANGKQLNKESEDD